MMLRISNWFYRFLLSTSIIGFANSIKILFLFHFSTRIRKIKFKSRYFYFRSQIDGVICHFYKIGYYIKENKEPIRTIIDAGANIGCETFRFRIHYPDAKIISIEASSENFQILLKNFEKDPKVQLINKALWNRNCELFLFDGGSSQSFYVSEHAGHGKEIGKISAISLNEVLTSCNIKHVDILKLDIEGAEKTIFAENIEWLSRVKCLIFEVPDFDAPFSTQLIYQQISKTGLQFRSYICSECLVLIREDMDWELLKINGFILKR